MVNKDLFINELLTYASFYIHNSSITNIKKIIDGFYDNEDIITAKKLLWEVAGSKLSSYSERKTTENRTSAEANINDIFEALQKLDSIESLPIFVAKDVEKIPDRQPEEINLIAIVNRISKLEKRNKYYEEALSNHEIDLQYIKSLEFEHKINEINNQINELECRHKIKEVTTIENEEYNSGITANDDSHWKSIDDN